MNSAASVERRIAAMLADEALIRVPEGALAAVLDRVDGTSQRRRTWPLPVIEVPRIDGRRRLVVALVAAILFAGIVVAGALLLRPPDPLKDLSSLVILEHQPYVEGGPARPVRVVGIAPDGSQRSLMTIEPSQLDGTYSEWYAGLSVDGHLVVPTSTEGGASVPAVLDLRDPTGHAIAPDAEGAFAHFGPDGRLAFSQNDGRVAIFDPLTATTSRVDVRAGVSLEERDFGPVWTADGGLVVTTGPISSLNRNAVGRFDVDDLTTTDSSRPYYSGVGARRVDADGRLLRCDPPTDDPCDGLITLHAVGDGFPTIWTQTDASVRVIDYAWAIDGGIWILTETVASGARTVALLHVNTQGGTERIATLSGGPDDPDPNTYSQAASFAAFSSDDARVVISLAGQAPQLWSIDPPTGTATRLPDGFAAGWLGPTTLSRPRPTVERSLETPEAMRGAWTREGVVMTVQRRGIEFPPGAALGRTAGRITPDGHLLFDGSYARCAAGPATYGWSLEPRGLRLVPILDECSERAATLGGLYARALDYPDTGSAATEPGTTYLASDFAVPFRITTPIEVPTSVESHSANVVTLSGRIGSGTPVVTLMTPGYGVQEPCDGDASPRTQLGPHGVQTYLRQQTQVILERAGTMTIAKNATPFVRAVPVDSAACSEIALFATGRAFRPWTITRSARFGVFDQGDQDVVILISTDTNSEAEERWVRELLASIEWQ